MKRKGRHIITTAIEHDSVLKPMELLVSRGFEVCFLKPGKDGGVSLSDFEQVLREDTILVSMMKVNNETGAVLPVEEIANLLRGRKSQALLHTDFVQGVLRLPFDAKSSGVDLISVSAHKLHGPKGAGALYIRRGVKLPPLLLGGGQESGARSGTEALPGIAGFAAAVRVALKSREEDLLRMQSLRKLAVQILTERLPELAVLGGEGAGHILSLSLPGYKSEVLMNFLDARGVYVSKGSACKRGGRSHVLEAMRLPAAVIDGTIRVSFSRETTIEELRYFCDCLIEGADTLCKALR